MFKNIGTTEILIIAGVLLLLFGGKKLPELAKGLTNTVKEFRKAFKEGGETEAKETETT